MARRGLPRRPGQVCHAVGFSARCPGLCSSDTVLRARASPTPAASHPGTGALALSFKISPGNCNVDLGLRNGVLASANILNEGNKKGTLAASEPPPRWGSEASNDLDPETPLQKQAPPPGEQCAASGSSPSLRLASAPRPRAWAFASIPGALPLGRPFNSVAGKCVLRHHERTAKPVGRAAGGSWLAELDVDVNTCFVLRVLLRLSCLAPACSLQSPWETPASFRAGGSLEIRTPVACTCPQTREPQLMATTSRQELVLPLPRECVETRREAGRPGEPLLCCEESRPGELTRLVRGPPAR